MDEGEFSVSDDLIEEFDDSQPQVTYYTDGKGRWLKRVWAAQCPETILFLDRCQGVAGHKGDHWCYRPDVEMAAKKGASAAAKKRVLAVRKGATWGK